MPQTTTHLALPLIAAAQAGKHVTHNEALVGLDALVQLACLDKDLAAPPASPAEGDRYLVTAANPTGAWTSLSGQVALYRDGTWTGLSPRPGWLAWVVDEGDLYTWTGTAWTGFRATLTALQNLTRLGIGTTADAGNPFAAKLNTALWTARTAAEGGSGDLRVALNKAAPANTLSLLFQSNFSGRAELGLTGDASWRLKVSSDGSSWTTPLTVRTNGRVEFGGQPPAPAVVNVVGALGAVGIAVSDNVNSSLYLRPFPGGTCIGGDGDAPLHIGINTGFAPRPWLSFRPYVNDVAPVTDNVVSLGSAAQRFKVLFAGTGSINTSDAREKTAVSPLTPAELAAAREIAAEIGTFRWLDAIEAKGEAARRHVGLTVQRAIEILRWHGLDPFAYGFVCRDAWDARPPKAAVRGEDGAIVKAAEPGHEASERYGFRTDELLMFLARGFEARLSALEAA